MSSVSRAMASWRSGFKCSRVRILCSRSVSLISTTLTSETMASSILRTFSACRSSRLANSILSMLVTPSTMRATCGPKPAAISSLHPLGRRLVVAHEPSVVPGTPVAGLLIEQRLAFTRALRIVHGQRHVAPRHAADFGLGRIPRMMGVGKAHPAEPVLLGCLLFEPANRPIGDPVRVIPLAGHGVELHLRGIGIASTGGVHIELPVHDLVKTTKRLGVLFVHPLGVVQRAHHSVGREFEHVEATMHASSAVEPVLLDRRDTEVRERVL